MKILIDRVYFREESTVGFLKLIFSGKYESKYLPAAGISSEQVSSEKAVYLCDTIEPRAIPWQNDPFIGQHAQVRIPGRTAIPEGHYEIRLMQSKSFRRKLPFLQHVPEFRKVCLRIGKTPNQSRGDILVGRLAQSCSPQLTDGRRLFQLLYLFICEAISYGEPVCLELSSARHWTYPAPD